MVFLLTSVISSCSEDCLWVVVEEDDGRSSYDDEDDSIGFVKLYECVCVLAAEEEDAADAAPADEDDATDAVAEYDVEVDEDTLVFVWL